MLLVLQPVGTILWAYLLFQEVFSVVQWAGLIMVIVGVTVVTAARSRATGRMRRMQSVPGRDFD